MNNETCLLYTSILDALDEIAEDMNQKGETRLEAGNISNKIQEFEFIFMMFLVLVSTYIPVSYTHLDVYKRQILFLIIYQDYITI